MTHSEWLSTLAKGVKSSCYMIVTKAMTPLCFHINGAKQNNPHLLICQHSKLIDWSLIHQMQGLLMSDCWWECHDQAKMTAKEARGCFKSTYELVNLTAYKFSTLYKNCIFQCMGKIFCVEFQRVTLKFHAKYLTIHWKMCSLLRS